ncbi:MAG: hypothetical protein K6347_03285 [Campylobacterales bacterium]
MNCPWLDQMLLAVANEDVDKIVALYGELPEEFATLEELQQARALIEQAIEILKKARHTVLLQMEHLKKSRAYLMTQYNSRAPALFNQLN